MNQTNTDLKIARLAGYFLTLAGGKMHKLKLMTLLYLADRYALGNYKMQLTDDMFISTKNGPALAHTRLMMNGEVLSNEWNLLIQAEADHEISCPGHITSIQDDDDDFNTIAIITLERVWNEYGGYKPENLVLLAKYDLKEWKEPVYGLIDALPLENVLKALAYDDAEALLLTDKINSRKLIAQVQHTVND